jgi:hypothetical protein
VHVTDGAEVPARFLGDLLVGDGAFQDDYEWVELAILGCFKRGQRGFTPGGHDGGVESQVDPAYLGQYAGDNVNQRRVLCADQRYRITGTTLPLQPDYIDWLHLFSSLIKFSISKIGVETTNYCHEINYKRKKSTL